MKSLNLERFLFCAIPAFGSFAWYETKTVPESLSSAISSSILFALFPAKTLDTWYLDALLFSCDGIASYKSDSFPVGSIL